MVTNNSINNEVESTFTVTGGNFLMDNTNSGGTTGVIKFGGLPFISNFGTSNTFLGQTAGNSTNTASYSVGIGYGALTNYVTGVYNTAVGFYALTSLTTGSSNVAVGDLTLSSVDISTNNIAIGDAALNSLVGAADGNIGIGSSALTTAGTCVQNIGIGSNSLESIVSGNYNVAIGGSSIANADVTQNVAIGFSSGSNYTGGETNNILIGANVSGITGESNATHIGDSGSTTDCYVGGIYGSTIEPFSQAVMISSDGKLASSVSSLRYKTNVIPLIQQKVSIDSLNPVSYTLKNDKTNQVCYGLIAEEVQKTMPELVLYNKNKDVESVRYMEIISLLIHEVKQLKSRIDTLEKK